MACSNRRGGSAPASGSGVAVGAAGSGAVPSLTSEQNPQASVWVAGAAGVAVPAGSAAASRVDTRFSPCGVQTSAQFPVPPAKTIARDSVGASANASIATSASQTVRWR